MFMNFKNGIEELLYKVVFKDIENKIKFNFKSFEYWYH